MPYKLRSDHPDCGGTAVVKSDTGQIVKCHPDRGKALAHLRALYRNVPDAAAPAVPGGPLHVVIEHHPGCPGHLPHGVTDTSGHLLACHATPEEARAIAEKLDLSEPAGDDGTAAARGGFDPLKHPRIEHGHGGGEFTHSPGGGGTTGHLHDGIADPPPSAALTFDGRFTLRDLPPDDKFLAKVNAKLTRPLIGTGPNKGKVRRPAVPPYRESVTRVSAAMTQLIAEQHTLEDGKKWYPDEHAMNHRRAQAYHVPITTAIGVEAATCPRVQWIINQRVTNELLDEVPKVGRTAEEIKRSHHFGGGVMSSFRDEGVDIILGADIDKELGGTKRRNFYNNIMWPGQTDSVTVDTWMLQALKPLGLNDDQAMALGQQAQAGLADGIGKVIVADALRDAAARYRAQGTDITPDGVQAAAWIAIQKQLGLSDPSAHANPRDVGYMHAAAAQPDPDDEGDGLTDDQWDAELLVQYLTWLAEKVPGGTDLGSPGSARPQGGLAADNPAAWKITTADPRFGRLGMTTAQAQQAARGPATPQAAAARTAGPYTVAENHPACPAARPHATVHSATGHIAGCHHTKDEAQTLALTLNFPDATPATPGAVMVAGAAKGRFREDLHPRKRDGKFAPKGQGGSGRLRPATPAGPATPRPAPGPGRAGETAPRRSGEAAALITPASERAFAASIAKDEADLQAAAAEKRISAEVHAQIGDAIAELQRTHAQISQAERAEIKAEEHRKIVRKLIHHVFALVGVVLMGFINHKLGTPDVLAGLTEASPLFVQEGLDFIKRV